MLRFFNSVQDVSNEQMQELWAKILAGEIKKPSTYSLRTLDALHNISTEEAKTFQKLCSYKVVSGCHTFIPDEKSIYEQYEIDFEDILRMEECGLLNTTGFLSLNKNIPTEYRIIFKSTSNVVVVKSKIENEVKIALSHYPFTSTGIEISKIFNTGNNDEYILDYARLIKEKNQNIEVLAYRIVREDEDGITYQQKDLLQ